MATIMITKDIQRVLDEIIAKKLFAKNKNKKDKDTEKDTEKDVRIEIKPKTEFMPNNIAAIRQKLKECLSEYEDMQGYVQQ